MIIIDKNIVSTTSPLSLSLHLDVALHLTAAEARVLVNRQVVIELGTGLIAHDPEELVVAREWAALTLGPPSVGSLAWRSGIIGFNSARPIRPLARKSLQTPPL